MVTYKTLAIAPGDQELNLASLSQHSPIIQLKMADSDNPPLGEKSRLKALEKILMANMFSKLTKIYKLYGQNGKTL